MKKHGKVLSVLLTAALILSIAACSGDNPEVTTANNQAQADTSNSTTKLDLPEASAAPIDENAPAGTVKWLGYYNIADDQSDHAALFASQYGGEVETELCTSGAGYFESLAIHVSSDLSPDLVRYEWMSFPHGISKNLYTPLNTYLNKDDPMWADVRTSIDRFEYAGKNYYFPQSVGQNFALNYNRTAVEYEALDDPMDLYLAGNWNWNTFKQLITQWCNIGEEYIGYTGVGGMSFTTTTGVKLIDVTNDGQIINNMKNTDIQRCMEFLEGLKKENLVGTGYVSPEEAFKDGKLLFLGMNPDWAYGAAQKALTTSGIENEMAVLPFPRDPNSDKYSIGYDTYGYMIPAGAKNIKGAIDWIICGRNNEIDPVKAAESKENATSTDPDYYPRCSECKYTFTEDEKLISVCPECNTPRKERFKVIYTPQQYEILEDMKDSSKFNLIFDDVYGFGDDFTNLFNGSNENGTILDGPLFNGDSYTQMRETYYETIEALLQPYREKLMKDIAEG